MARIWVCLKICKSASHEIKCFKIYAKKILIWVLKIKLKSKINQFDEFGKKKKKKRTENYIWSRDYEILSNTHLNTMLVSGSPI